MHRLIPLPLTGNKLTVTPAGHLRVSDAALVFDVDPATGARTPTAERDRDPFALATEPSRVLPAHGLRLSQLETLRGPVTRLLDAATGSERAVFAGFLRILVINPQGLFAAYVETPQGPEAVAGRLGSSRVVRVASPDWGGAACAGDDFVAITTGGPRALHVFRPDLSRVSVGFPTTKPFSPAVALGTIAWIVAERALVGIDTAALPRGDATLGITLDGVVPPAQAAAETAKVAFTLGPKAGFDHPRFGRIVTTLGPSDPHVARGDEVLLDDVFEELPGVFRVRAWRPKGAGASIAPPPPPATVLFAPAVSVRTEERGALPELRPHEQERAGRLDAKLAALAAQHGFRVPKTLAVLLRAAEDDATVKRWLSILGLKPEIGFVCAEWGADPFVLTFGGDGDHFALYPWPPVLPASNEPPIVEWLHDTNEATLLAYAFDTFLSSHLAAMNEEPELQQIADHLVARFGLPKPVAHPPPPAPTWLATYPPEVGVLARADALVASDPLAAERLLVTAWIGQGKDALPARERLLKLYASLGWTLPAEAFRAHA